jgi:molecular chaperone IbpA
MRKLNLDSFWRTSIGFDRLFDLMDESPRFEPEDHYPPCNIVRTGEDSYRISLGVAGFKPDQLNVTVSHNTLIVTGNANEKQGEGEYLYKSIAGRSFERLFNLADYVEVKGASVEEDLLQIELERDLPEAMKPRRIDIRTGQAIDLRLGLETDLFRHTRLAPTFAIFGRILRQVQPIGHRQTCMVIGNRQRHHDLTIVLLAKLAAILPRYPDRVPPLFGKAGVVDDPGFNRTVTLDLRQHHLAHLGQHPLVRPSCVADKMQQ